MGLFPGVWKWGLVHRSWTAPRVLGHEFFDSRWPSAPGESLAERLRAALEGLLDDGERRAAWGRANRARVEELYAQEVMVERYRALYREAVAAARPRS